MNNSRGFMGQRSTLPDTLLKMDMDSFMSMIRNLDPDSTGFINIRQLLTYLILLQSAVPSQAQADKLRELADAEGHISKDSFVEASFWFEQTEASTDGDYHEPFERRHMIKESLFEANAMSVEGKEGLQIPCETLIRVLRLPAASGAKCNTFNDWIFAKVQGLQH